MREIFSNGEVLKNCKIFSMLMAQSEREHHSFHTPGHKQNGWDITELSYSDNLSSPRGCILQAERDIAKILHAHRSFILTDGSTCGVFSMLQAVKSLGAQGVAFCETAHKSVYNACFALGLIPLPYTQETPFINQATARADVLLITSPDYYGRVADLALAREYCEKYGKFLLVDGAHGGHLHFDQTLHASGFADMWVDGVHKSLPALTQGAVVSARSEKTAEALARAVEIFRTTSPSYPIMASVEYAVKYPRNIQLESAVRAFKHPRVNKARDWTKLCARFGKNAYTVKARLESEGIFAEFCDGDILAFYLSPATKMEEFEGLKTRLCALFEEYPLEYAKSNAVKTVVAVTSEMPTVWMPLELCAGKVCASPCGLFPPCTPLLTIGEIITEEKLEKLRFADNVFGVCEGKILVVK